MFETGEEDLCWNGPFLIFKIDFGWILQCVCQWRVFVDFHIELKMKL